MQCEKERLPGGEKLFSGNINGRNITGGPGILKVESAGNAIYIQYLPGKEQVRYFPAHHSVRIYFTQCNAAGCYKFFFIGSLTFYFKLIGTKVFDEFVLFF